MDVGEPIREIEVVPKHIPVPAKEPEKIPTPKEKETVKNASLRGRDPRIMGQRLA